MLVLLGRLWLQRNASKPVPYGPRSVRRDPVTAEPTPSPSGQFSRDGRGGRFSCYAAASDVRGIVLRCIAEIRLHDRLSMPPTTAWIVSGAVRGTRQVLFQLAGGSSRECLADGPVLGDNHGPAIRMSVDRVATFRAHVGKPSDSMTRVILRIGRSESAGLTPRPVPGTR